MNKDEFSRRVTSSPDPLKALARIRVQERRKDRMAAKVQKLSVERLRAQRVAAALNATFALLAAKVRGR